MSEDPLKATVFALFRVAKSLHELERIIRETAYQIGELEKKRARP